MKIQLDFENKTVYIESGFEWFNKRIKPLLSKDFEIIDLRIVNDEN